MDIARITEAATKSALESIRRAEPMRDNALLEMQALQRRLDRLGASVTRESLEWSIGRLILDLVAARLSDLGGIQVAGVSENGSNAATRDHPRTPSAPTGEAVVGGGVGVGASQLSQGLTSADPDLEAWCCLYARYLAPRTLQVQEIAGLARPGSPHGRRLIGRRIQRGVRQLTNLLRDEERQTQRSWARVTTGDVEGSRTNLPQRRRRFVGRQLEMETIASSLSRSPLITLVGPAGIGKTRLATEYGWRSLDDYEDGVWVVELAPVSDPDGVPQALATALGVSQDEHPSVLGAVLDWLSSRRCLIVLDNCEHLIETAAELADTLLSQCPGHHLMATSREALGVEGEAICTVPALPLHTGVGDSRTERFPPAVELFVDRASAASERELESELDRIAELCERLDGLPLAIELAATQVRTLSVAEILARMDDRFSLLTGGPRTSDDRQLTLRRAFDWSFDLLTAAERDALLRLSVFRGTWTIAGAGSVCPGSDGDVLDSIRALVEKSLVAAGAGHDVTRFRMLESVRQYAADRLRERGDTDEVRALHQEHFLGLVERASDGMDGSDQLELLNLLDRERENWVAALVAGSVDTASAARALALAGHLTRYWQLRGLVTEGRRWLTFALQLPGNEAGTPERANALNGCGTLAYMQGDYQAAQAVHEEALQILTAQQDEAGCADARRNLGKVADAKGDYGLARGYYEAALATYSSLGDGWGRAATLNNLGLLALREGDPEAAMARLEESLRAFRQIEDVWAIGITLANLADAALAQGDRSAARELFTQSLVLAEQVGDRDGEAYALTSLGSVAIRDGHVETAQKHLSAALEPLIATEAKPGIAEWLEASAFLARSTDQSVTSVQLLAAADALRHDIRAPLPEKDIPERRALVRFLREQLGETDFQAASQQGRRLGWQAAVESAKGVTALGLAPGVD